MRSRARRPCRARTHHFDVPPPPSPQPPPPPPPPSPPSPLQPPSQQAAYIVSVAAADRTARAKRTTRSDTDARRATRRTCWPRRRRQLSGREFFSKKTLLALIRAFYCLVEFKRTNFGVFFFFSKKHILRVILICVYMCARECWQCRRGARIRIDRRRISTKGQETTDATFDAERAFLCDAAGRS